jgi:cytochrome c-type biogenesis protein CcmH/NrfG
MRKKLLGEEHSDTLSSLLLLAVAYREQGRSKEAGELGVRLIEMTVRVFRRTILRR